MSDTVGAVDLTSEAFQELRLSPEMATAALAEKTAAFRLAESRSAAEKTAAAEKAARDRPAPVDSGSARARLDGLVADPQWRADFLAGKVENRAIFAKLTTAIAAGSAVTDMLAGAGQPLSHEIEVTANGELSSHKLAVEIAHLKDLGLNPDLIKQAVEGAPVSAAEREMARQVKEMRLADPVWVAAWQKNGFSQRREMLLLNLILSAEAAA